MDKTSIGDRMKRYENISRIYLPRRIPVIIRLDGKAFHSFTRRFKKPFDRVLMEVMQLTMKHLCEGIQGCVFGYTQSDEISLVLTDYATIHTDAWFGYNVQKMVSVAASMATIEFNKAWVHECCCLPEGDERDFYLEHQNKAMFDARCFSIPKDEVCNCLIWRQQDATRNSIEAAGHANYSQSQLHKKTCNQIQEMLFQKGINWNDYPTDFKRGSACYRVKKAVEMEDPRNPGQMITVERNTWEIDREIPIFTSDRNYIERWL